MASVTRYWRRRCPYRCIKSYLSGSELLCPIDDIREEHWPFLLAALSADVCLTSIHLISNCCPDLRTRRHPYKNIPYGCCEDNISSISQTFVHYLPRTRVLHTLCLENLLFSNEDVMHISVGLSENTTLKHLSLAGCPLKTSYVDGVCYSLDKSEIEWVDFSCTGIGVNDLDGIVHLIQFHGCSKKEAGSSKKRPRDDLYEEGGKSGLRRISLNWNNFGKGSLEPLLECLYDNETVVALDFQKCSLSMEEPFAKLLDCNSTLEVLDLRENAISHLSIGVPSLVRMEERKATPDIDLQLDEGQGWQRPFFVSPAKRQAKQQRPSMALKIRKRTSPIRRKETTLRKFLMDRALNDKTSYPIFYEMLPSAVRRHMACQTEDARLDGERNMMSDREVHAMLLNEVQELKRQNADLQHELEKYNWKEFFMLNTETFLELKRMLEKLKAFLEVMKQYELWEFIAMMGVNEHVDLMTMSCDPNDNIKYVALVENEPQPEMEPAPAAVPDGPTKPYCNCPNPDCKVKARSAHASYDHIPDEDSALKEKITADKLRVEKAYKELCAAQGWREEDFTGKGASTNMINDACMNKKQKSALKAAWKSLSKVELPSKLKQFKSPEELYRAVQREMDIKCDICDLAAHNPQLAAELQANTLLRETLSSRSAQLAQLKSQLNSCASSSKQPQKNPPCHPCSEKAPKPLLKTAAPLPVYTRPSDPAARMKNVAARGPAAVKGVPEKKPPAAPAYRPANIHPANMISRTTIQTKNDVRSAPPRTGQEKGTCIHSAPGSAKSLKPAAKPAPAQPTPTAAKNNFVSPGPAESSLTNSFESTSDSDQKTKSPSAVKSTPEKSSGASAKKSAADTSASTSSIKSVPDMCTNASTDRDVKSLESEVVSSKRSKVAVQRKVENNEKSGGSSAQNSIRSDSGRTAKNFSGKIPPPSEGSLVGLTNVCEDSSNSLNTESVMCQISTD